MTITNGFHSNNNHHHSNNNRNSLSSADKHIEIYDMLMCADYQKLSAQIINSSNNIELYLPYLVELSTIIPDFDSLLFELIPDNLMISVIQEYLSLDFDSINEFIHNEFQTRKKLSHLNDRKDTFLDSITNPRIQFENGSADIKLKLVISDLIELLEYSEKQEIEQQQHIHQQQQLSPPFYHQQHHHLQQQFKLFESSLFLDTPIYISELNIILSIITFKSSDLIDIKDEIELLSNIIANRPDQIWFKESLLQQKESLTSFNEIRDLLLSTIEKTAQQQHSSKKQKIIIKSILRLYCGFNGLLGIKLNSSEVNALCEGLLKMIQPNIALIVKNILGYRPSIHTESLNQIGELLTKEIFTEALVSKKSASLPIIENLNSNDQNISIMCIYHLLSERIFEKYENDVGPWVWNQVLKSSTPIHYLLPSCLDQLSKNIIEPSITVNNTSFYMKRISEWSILNIFNNSGSNQYPMVVQVLVIYFVLRFNDSVIKFKNDQKGKNISYLIETSQLKEYSLEFLTKLPIQKCLTIIYSNPNDYFFIMPPFLYLMASQFPQFFNIGLLLLEEERISNPIEKFTFLPQFYSDSIFNNSKTNPSLEFLIGSLKKTLCQPTTTQLILRYLTTLSNSELLPYTLILIQYLLPILIQNRSSPGIEGLISPFSDIWSRVFPTSQSEIALKTINILTLIYSNEPSANIDSQLQLPPHQPLSSSSPSQYSHIDIISDPLMIFRSHPTGSGKQEEISTLILTQESSIIQLLLEICIIDRIQSTTTTTTTTSGEKNILYSMGLVNNNIVGDNKLPYDSADIEEIRCLICNFIHQIFIEKPLIIKLIHFQGYLPQLLPITTTHIPSMHICFEFLPELLNQPILEKQIFSIQLLSYLAEKYPLPKSLKICRLSLHRIVYNLNSFSGGGVGGSSSASSNTSANAATTTSSSTNCTLEDKEKFLHQILPAITRITKTFPILAEDCIQILMEQLPNKNNFYQNVKNQFNYEN
eukprot:gene5187-6455_t